MRSVEIADRDDAERPLDAVVFSERDILAGNEPVLVELEPCLVVIVARRIVVEGPASAGLMDKTSDLVLLAAPKPLDDTTFAVSPPVVSKKMPSSSSGAANS